MAYTVDEQIGPFWVGDVPLTATTLSLTDQDGNAVDLAPVTGVTAQVGAVSLTASVVADTIVIVWPLVSLFAVEGISSLELKLTTATGSVTVEPVEFVVQSRSGWHSLDTARRDWRDAPDSDAGLYVLLDTARVQVQQFAPVTVAGAVPLRYKQAQLMQARNVWNAAKSDTSNQMGADGFTVHVFPMDWTVKNIIRPKNPVPVVA
ncbi:hypothetical protein E3T28_14815 [Cryobacterium sinapicolor]|uniref:Uncharacterized protein n=1 Tax=Cryobacterium sinapicolor TaxID=1259236 RepID=A0ABY2IVC8_9MICO|nr:hypothetical protein [Cryobacterium sinapicolor]TFC94571.1 hypothetical protein E3T28_14815 [Cryobacterium sinapicolor]